MNTYKRIQQDFSFLKAYGCNFDHIEHHYVMPSVVFCSSDKKIQVGMDYESGAIFILYSNDLESFGGDNLLENVNFFSRKYKD